MVLKNISRNHFVSFENCDCKWHRFTFRAAEYLYLKYYVYAFGGRCYQLYRICRGLIAIRRDNFYQYSVCDKGGQWFSTIFRDLALSGRFTTKTAVRSSVLRMLVAAGMRNSAA